MVQLRKIVLDVLKPHQPNALEFSEAIAAAGNDYHVRLIVTEVDEHTETLEIQIEGEAINFEEIEAAIKQMGGTVHSIDEVETHSGGAAGDTA